jgi:hypothetical protein
MSATRDNPNMANAPEVRTLALQFCDDLYQEPITRKTTLLGLFNHWNSPVYPVEIDSFVVYFEFIAQPATEPGFVFQFVRTGSDPNILATEPIKYGPVTDPFGTFIALKLLKFPIPAPGLYRAQFLADGAVVAARDLMFNQT